MIAYIIRRTDRRGPAAVRRQRGHIRDLLRGARSSRARRRANWPRSTSGATRAQPRSRRSRRTSASTSRCYVQYWHFLKPHVRRAPTYNVRPGHGALPRRRASATRSRPTCRCGPTSPRRLPVTLSLAVGAAVIWLVSGVCVGVISALRPGTLVRPVSMSDRLGRRLAAGLLHRPAALQSLFRLQVARSGQTCTTSPFTTESAEVGVQPDPAVDHAGLPLRGALRPAHPRRHAGDDERGLHPHRAGQGPAASARSSSSTACAPR